MARDTATPDAGEVASEVGGWMVGGGVLTMTLFPFALPILALTVAALLPLLAPLLLLAVLLTPALIVRAVVRAIRRRRARRELSFVPPGGATSGKLVRANG